MTAVATRTAEPANDSNLLLLVVAGFVFLIMLILALVCLCRSRLHAHGTEGLPPSLSEQPGLADENMMASLIPPLFYTEDLRDPLLQADLRDRVTARRPSDVEHSA
jgi:uncharacterized membrane protein YhaH (DUF805 family)